MNNRNEIYRSIDNALVHIVVAEADKVISVGSGFVFTEDGAVLTASHVLAGGFPVKAGEIDLPGRSITVFRASAAPAVYRPVVGVFEVQSKAFNPVQFDLAIIAPVEPPQQKASHLIASTNPPDLGDEIYMAGYSDEVEFPFLFNRNLHRGTEGLDILQRNYETAVKDRVAGALIKRATVGNVREAAAYFDDKAIIKQSIFYVDNVMHSGASGGPIVNEKGKACGIISKRTVTKLGDQVTSAGSTLGVALEPLMAISNRASQAA